MNTIKFKLFVFALVLALCVALTFFVNKYTQERKRSDRLVNNAIALTSEIESYKVRLDDSIEVSVAKVHQITLERNEYRRLYKAEADTNKKLRIHNSELRSIATVAMSSKDTVKGDTVYVTSEKELKADYKSAWIDISCKIDPVDMTSQFTYDKRERLKLIKEVEQVRLLWGLIRWNKNKTATYQVVSFDPKTTVTELQYIEITK